MSTRDTSHPRWISWVVLPVGFLAIVPSTYLGDMVYICLKYGRQTWFAEGLRFVKHKPCTLSTGVVLSQNQDFVVWLVSAIIWLALIVGTVAVLVAISNLFRKIRVRPGARQIPRRLD